MQRFLVELAGLDARLDRLASGDPDDPEPAKLQVAMEAVHAAKAVLAAAAAAAVTAAQVLSDAAAQPITAAIHSATSAVDAAVKKASDVVSVLGIRMAVGVGT
jgi:hypothetical protein